MDDRRALMAAIIADPDDDTPRLAFADWLQEHGDEHDQARAEFIRKKIELPFADDDRAAELEPQTNAIQAAHALAWLGDLQESWEQTRFPKLGPNFEEGVLLASWDVHSRRFVTRAHQAAVCKGFPRVGVRTLHLADGTDDDREVSNSVALEWVSSLSWRYSRTPDEGLRALAASPHTFRISSFESDSACSDAGLLEFAGSSCWPNLQSFGLIGRHLPQSATLAGFVHLLNSDRFPKLESLWFLPPSVNGSAQFFQCANLSKLRRLSLGRGTDVSALVACPYLTELVNLSVADSTISDADVFAFCDNPAFERLQSVTFSDMNEEGSPLSPIAMKRLEDRFESVGFVLDYSVTCIRN